MQSALNVFTERNHNVSLNCIKTTVYFTSNYRLHIICFSGTYSMCNLLWLLIILALGIQSTILKWTNKASHTNHLGTKRKDAMMALSWNGYKCTSFKHENKKATGSSCDILHWMHPHTTSKNNHSIAIEWLHIFTCSIYV